MTRYRLERLEPLTDRLAEIRTTGGELLRAIVEFVFDEERSLCYVPVSTNQPERYPVAPRGTGSVIPWEYIVQICEVPAAEAIEEVLGPARAPLLAKYGPRRGEQLGWVGGDRYYQGRAQPDGGVVFRGGGK